MASRRKKSNNQFAALENIEDDISPLKRADTTSKTLKNVLTKPRNQQATEERPLAILCATCDSIFNHEGSEEWFGTWHNHHKSQPALHDAVSMGCVICKLITQYSWAHAWKPSPEQSQLAGNQYDPDCLKYKVEQSFKLTHTLEIGYSSDETGFALSSLAWIMLKPEDVESQLHETHPPPSTASDRAWDLCRYWLRLCRTEHKRCGNQDKDSTFRPSRLIHVEGCSNGSIQARLDCGKPTKVGFTYLTFSHCWGSSQFLTLGRKNLNRLKKSITIKELSKAFQDALLTTLKLGFNYIWIDSLCIVQDSTEDWLQQSEQMGEIYKHSSCNVAATGFTDGSRGFFVNRDIDSIICQKVQATWKGTWKYTKQPRGGTYYLVEDELWTDQVSQAPLNRRGWVVQERLLSPCVLHFGNRQLLWECFESHNCETFPSGFPQGILTSTHFKTLFFYESTSKIGTASNRRQSEHDLGAISDTPGVDESDIYNSWHEIVETYSIGQLTRVEDKLVAISGAAKQVRNISKDRYLAGLWERNFLRDLLWQVSYGSDVGLTLLTYRAPTWSWASLDAGISYVVGYQSYSGIEELHAELKYAELTYATEDDTGLVTGGFVFIEGPLLEVRPTERSSTELWFNEYIVSGTRIKLDVSLDFGRKSAHSSGSGFRLRREKDAVFRVSTSYGFKEHFLRNQALYILPIRTTPNLVTNELEVRGLILSRTGCDRGQYIRVGVFVAEEEKARDAVMTPSLQLAPDLWQEDCGHGRYVIMVV